MHYHVTLTDNTNLTCILLHYYNVLQDIYILIGRHHHVKEQYNTLPYFFHCFHKMVEDCFFGIYGGTLRVIVANLTLETEPKGILIGGTGPFGGVSGSFGIRKIVEDQAIIIFEIDFSFDDIDRAVLPLFSLNQFIMLFEWSLQNKVILYLSYLLT